MLAKITATANNQCETMANVITGYIFDIGDVFVLMGRVKQHKSNHLD